MFSWQSTVSTQVSHTVRRLKSELCIAPARVPKTFPVEVRPGSRPPLRPCLRDKSNVLAELSNANMTIMDVSEKKIAEKWKANLEIQKNEIGWKSSGLELADQFILKYPKSFTMRFSDHAMSHECPISDACLKQDYVKGYQIFLSMKQKKKPIALDTANKLLDLFCYHGYKNSKIKDKVEIQNDNDDAEVETGLNIYVKFYKRTITNTHSWSTENAASELFAYMDDKDDLSYNLMIQSMIKYASGDPILLDLALVIYKEMISLNYKPSIDTYKALIYSTRYDTEINMITLLKEMFSESFVKPDSELFVLLLEVLFIKTTDSMEIRNTTKRIMEEFHNSNITCSFGDFHKMSVLLESAHMKKYCYDIFHKIITTRKHLLTFDKGDIEDYGLLLHLLTDYSLMMSPQEVLDLLDYINDNKVVHMIGEKVEKGRFALRILTKYSETADADSLKQVYSKLDDIWKDDIPTQMVCATIILKRTRISREEYVEHLISLAEKLDDLEKKLDQEDDDIIRRCDSIYHYSTSMWMQCRSYVKNFDGDADMDTLKRLQEINIKLMLKMQENNIIPNQNSISNIIFTTLYTNDIVNAWKLFNLYGEYEIALYSLALKELLKVSKLTDYREFLTAQTLIGINRMEKSSFGIDFALDEANRQFDSSLKIL